MPGHYSHLAAFYEDKKGVLRPGPGRGGSLPPVCWLPSIHRYMYPEMKVRSAVLSRVLDSRLGTVVLNFFFFLINKEFMSWAYAQSLHLTERDC